jgi:hypothetical protein
MDELDAYMQRLRCAVVNYLAHQKEVARAQAA